MKRESESYYSFSNDFMFCTVLYHNKDLCKELIEVLLDVKVRDIEYIKSQETKDISLNSKGIRLDVYVEDDNNTVFDLEMQTTVNRNLPKRGRYYQGLIDQTLIGKGEDYDKLKKSYIIFICLNDPFKANLSRYTFRKVCKEDGSIIFDDDTEMVFLNASGRREGISDRLQSFLDYLKTAEATDDFTTQVEEKVRETNASPEWRKERMTLEMKLKDVLEEGKIQGREEGREEGKKDTLIMLVKEKLLVAKDAANQLGITEEEFLNLMNGNL